ncbi:MAG: MBL fold metallo-hydrolase [Candidatus Nanohaloarchaea archaeon]
MRGATSFDSVRVDWLEHASIKLRDSDGFTVYVDPWSEPVSGEELREMEKADVIISTHDHFDHFDVKAIQALKKDDTVLVCTEESEDEVPDDVSYKVIRPNRSVKARGLKIRGVPAYNVDKFRSPGEPFHPEGFCVGVIFELDGLKFYHASDTDPVDEMGDLPGDIDVAFMPVGGHYTMDQDEAIDAINMVKPDKVVPIHYGYVDHTTANTSRFEEDVREKTVAEPVVLD